MLMSPARPARRAWLHPTRLLLLAWLLAAVAASAGAESQWVALGPEGGDVRRLAHDPSNPDRVYLGTSAGQLYLSEDGGRSWNRLARLGSGDHYVLDSIVIHPAAPETVYVAGWSLQGNGGGLFRSRDQGRTWESLPGMQGKSIRSLALAASDSYVLAAGTLEGVFLSRDRGESWERISPEGHEDIKNIGSLAIDPRSPDVIYAGTWHLPWKTMNGGRTWENIKNGLIDDSDIFSIVIDPARPSRVYVSACSGIYRSEDGGAQFRKLPGIPFSARRTRVLHQDPQQRQVLYAGTTEGLWKSNDGGESWQRISAATLVVNDVLVDPRQSSHVLVATERAGILRSENAGTTFASANRGFSHRQAAAMLVDREQPTTVYVGLVNDKEFGGVFVSDDLGAHWRQLNDGLGLQDIFTLAQGEDGTLLAGTNRGIFALPRGARRWEPRNSVVRDVETTRRVGGRDILTVRPEASEFAGRVFQLETTPGRWLAATSAGLFASRDQGRTWNPVDVPGQREIISARASDRLMVAVGRRAVLISHDGGANWDESELPDFLVKIYGVTLGGDQAIWLATREGAFRSRDRGQSWERILGGLPGRWISSISYDPEGQRLLATSSSSPYLFQSTDGGERWQPLRTGWPLRGVAASRGRLLAATAFDGVIAEPVVLAQEESGAAPGGGASGPCSGEGC